MPDEQMQKILTQLENHESRLRALEAATQKSHGTVPTAANKQTMVARNKGENLFPPIQRLFENGFLKEWQTDLDVCDALSQRLLTKKRPLRASVVNVMRAMVRKGLLTREKISRDKRQVFAYKQP